MAIKFNLLPPPSAVQEITMDVLLDHRGALQDVADLLGWPRSTLYSHLNPAKVKALNWDAVRASYAVTRDARLAPFLVPPGFEIRPAAESAQPIEDAVSEIADVSDAAGVLRAYLKTARADGRLDIEERERLAELIKDLDTELAEAKKALKDEGVNV